MWKTDNLFAESPFFHEYLCNAGEGYRQQHADDAEKSAANQNAEHHPEPGQAHSIATKPGNQDVAFDGLNDDGGDEEEQKVRRAEDQQQ